MEERRILNEKTALAELKFAIEHKIDFCAHNIDELLSPDEIQNICNELKIKAKIYASFMTDTSYKRAYYILDFYRENGFTDSSIGTYFGIDLVSSNNDKKFEPEDEEDQEQCYI